jgi:hypothetical protein
MPTVSAGADVARETDGAGLGGLGGDLPHPGVGLLVLLAITALNVLGLTQLQACRLYLALSQCYGRKLWPGQRRAHVQLRKSYVYEPRGTGRWSESYTLRLGGNAGRS